jgi:SHS2 domain-containing protein
MKSFEIISHTADVRIKAYGINIKSLFEEALKGLIFVLQPNNVLSDKNKKIFIDISVNSYDKTALLIDFLSEALTQMYIKNVLIRRVEFLEITNNTLKGKLTAYYIDKFAVDIKAVTYHEAEIIFNKLNEYECTVVLDI